MRRLRAMVWKDLLRKRRSPHGTLLLLAFPLVFSALLAASFGARGQSLPRVRLLVQNQDEGLAGRLLLGAFTSQQLATYFDVKEVGEEGRGLIEKGDGSALLSIPRTFTRDLLDGRPVSLSLVRNPAEGVLPEVAEQVAGTLAEGLTAASRVLRGPLDQIAPLVGSGRGPEPETLSRIAVAVGAVIGRVDRYVFPPAITLTTVTPATGEKTGGGDSVPSIFLFVLPGIAVFSLFTIGDQAMRDILTESAAGTLQRQLSGPISGLTIVLAKALYTALLSGVCLLVLSAVGWTFLGRSVDVPGFIALSAALVLSVIGFTSLIYGLARSERQGATFSSVIYLLMAFSGGSFIPLESLPGAMRRISPFSLFYWGTNGFHKLVQEDAGILEVLPNVGVLAVGGAVLLVIGGAALERRVRRGATQ